jgi:hypothetical protein
MSKNLTIQEAKERIQRLEKLKNQASTTATLKHGIDKRIKDLETWIANHSRF